MKIDAKKLQIMTAAAILVLISGGIAAYAQDQTSSSTSIAIPTTGAAPPAPAATSDNSSQTSTSNSTSTVTTIMTATTNTTSHSLCTPPSVGHVGRLTLPIRPTQPTTGAGTIVFSQDNVCKASITAVGGIFSVDVQLRFAKPVTQYNIVLVANGTSHVLGNLVAGRDGNGQIQDQVLLTPGTFVVSIQIFDMSSNPGQSTLVLQSSQGIIVSPPFPTTTTTGHQQQ